ncbi:MAG: hypothetical protein R3Y32_04175 [Bacillota bacterium]
MENNEKIDNLVDMIDNLMANGQGHVNVFCNAEDGEVVAEAVVSKDCGCNGKSACAQPTVFFDEDKEEEN